MINIDNARSYATEANLQVALKKYHLDDRHPIIVCNRAGRFTAVFSAHRLEGDLAYAPGLGFPVI